MINNYCYSKLQDEYKFLLKILKFDYGNPIEFLFNKLINRFYKWKNKLGISIIESR